MPHDPAASILDMVEAIERAQRLGGGTPLDAFLADERTQWAVYSQIVIVGEAAGRVPPEYQARYPEVPWSSAIGMRHRLVHGYDTVDFERVWRTLSNDLPALLEQLKELAPAPFGPGPHRENGENSTPSG